MEQLELIDLAERNGGAMSTEERYDEIVQHYLSCEFTTRDIAEVYKISPRQIQRIVKLYGCTQNKAERMRIAWQKSKPLKEYNALSKSMKKGVRPQIKPKDRLTVLQRDNFTCQFCGAGKENQLHIDHINQDPKDNHLDNLRVLCAQCNYGRNGHYGSWRMELNTKYVDVIRKRYAKFVSPDNTLPENWEELTPEIAREKRGE